MKNVAVSLLIIISSVLILSGSALADQKTESSQWQHELAPFYLWAINIDGDVGIRGRTTSTQVDFNTVWDNLEGVVTLRYNLMYNNKFGVLVDYNYLDLGTEKVNDMINTEVGFKSQIFNLVGIYRIMSGAHTLDATAGIRYTSMDVDFLFNNLGQRFDTNYNWTDPIIGLRYGYDITPQWSLRMFGDIGGFGVGSDFTWQGAVLVNYQAWQNVVFVAGYRALGADYESGGTNNFTYDAITHGPLIGLDIRF